MTDLETAVRTLPGHTLALCRDGAVLTSDRRGVAPMVTFLREGRDLTGYAAADRVVGKAAAWLFIEAGIREVYAATLSAGGKALLETHGIPVQWDTLTAAIENRDKTGICPMEQAVAGIDDPQAAYEAIARRLSELRAGGRP